MKYLEDVLIAPLISEKSYDRIADSNSYTFFVHKNSNKPEIKKAVQADKQRQVLDTLDITANDNVKTRLINSDMQNSFLRNSKSNIRSQWYTYTYFKKILNN